MMQQRAGLREIAQSNRVFFIRFLFRHPVAGERLGGETIEISQVFHYTNFLSPLS